MPEADPDKIQPPEHLREADKSWPDHGRYDQELRVHLAKRRSGTSNWHLPYYGFSHVELAIGHGDQSGRPLRALAQARAMPMAMNCAGARINCRGIITSRRRPGARAIPEELYPTAYVAERTMKYLENYSRTRPRQAVFPAMLVSRSASSVHAAGAILGYVRS